MKASGYWNSLQFKEEELLSSVNVSKFCRDLDEMDVTTLVFLLVYFGREGIRYENILKPLCRRIEEFIPLNEPSLVNNVLNSLSRLGWSDARLITKLKHEVLEFRHDPYLLQFSLLPLAHLRLTDRYFWRQIIESLEPKLETKQIPILSLYHISQAFALANVDCRLTFPFGQTFSKNFYRSAATLNGWLEFAYILTCFNCLNNSVAESVLDVNFVDAIKKSFLDRKKRSYDNMRLKTISCAAKLELSNYKGPFFVDKLTPKLYSTGQEWHEATGVIIEGRCFVDKSKREFIPLNKVETERSQGTTCKEVAILFFTKKQVTRIFDPTEDIGPVRLVGVCQTGIRLLKKAGLHPVVFTEEQFQSFNDERTKVEYIRNRLLDLSEDFHENNWLLDETRNE
uniref:Uncharacterized protein n=1 Tax=Meloidogyne hapla TaxID=6305 RepID=A0A1I8BSL9_MELHA